MPRWREVGTARRTVSAVLGGSLLIMMVVAGVVSAQRPRCFGAAARAPDTSCAMPVNRSATPAPFAAVLEPSEPCTSVGGGPLEPCHFGVAPANARRAVALLGDSHAVHWRAALAVAAATRDWAGVSLTRSNCPFTYATTPGKGRCGDWAHRVVAWIRDHPDVRTVVVSANSGSGVVPAARLGSRETKRRGYLRAWDALPTTVTRVIVVHDVPHSRSSTRACVASAVRRRQDAGLRCARPRFAALRDDLEAEAAARTTARRVRPVDLSQFMCDEHECFPVVGGALVIKDIGHLTRTFSRTLGPYLGQAIDAEIAQPGRTTTGTP